MNTKKRAGSNSEIIQIIEDGEVKVEIYVEMPGSPATVRVPHGIVSLELLERAMKQYALFRLNEIWKSEQHCQ